jgi:hypothetical protein
MLTGVHCLRQEVYLDRTDLLQMNSTSHSAIAGSSRLRFKLRADLTAQSIAGGANGVHALLPEAQDGAPA